MKTTVDVTGMKETIATLHGLENHSRIAAAVAITRLAKIAQKEIVQTMATKFDRPTPMTMRSVVVLPATAERLKATVMLNDREMGGQNLKSMSQTIGQQFLGGGRILKRVEQRLSRMGILPLGMYVAPGRGAPLDAYGNIQRGAMIKMLQQKGGFDEQGSSRMSNSTFGRLKKQKLLVGRGSKGGRSVLRSQFFVAKGRGNKPIGIWQLAGSGRVVPFLAFVSSPSYQVRIPFNQIAIDVAKREMKNEFNKAFKQALGNAGSKGKWK